MIISVVVIHQQIRQLFWHLLICFGLVMVLPVEEAIINFREGAGFFSDALWAASVAFSPLLMGLIACANVQADLSEKRYIFWRSKPASTKLFISVKYFVGLIAGLLIVACPMLFAFISCRLNSCGTGNSPALTEMLPYILMGIMSYSLCFGSNVLIRRSARAWLIGMVATGFVLLVPFMLPLGYKDLDDVIGSMSVFYVPLVVIVSTVAFVLSLFASERDWHLKTNMKRLLWAGFGLVFVVMMLLGSQIANIRILQEKQIENIGQQCFTVFDGRILLRGQDYINISKDSISLEKGCDNPFRCLRTKCSPKAEGDKEYRASQYPEYPGPYHMIGGDVYFFSLLASGWGTGRITTHEKFYLRSIKLVDTHWEQAGELDISDCRKGTVRWHRMAMRYIDNKIVAYINGNHVVVDVSSPSQMKLIEQKFILDRTLWYSDKQREIAMPLVPIDGIDIKERIRLSIDLYSEAFFDQVKAHQSSVIIDGDRISFFRVSEAGVQKYDVTGWDDEKVYCKFSAERPFTMLERIPDPWYRCVSVKNGKLYTYSYHQLMVFDIRSGKRIRKLGHFARSDFIIEDIEVLENGNMLMCLSYYYKVEGTRMDKVYLYLLKDPQ